MGIGVGVSVGSGMGVAVGVSVGAGVKVGVGVAVSVGVGGIVGSITRRSASVGVAVGSLNIWSSSANSLAKLSGVGVAVGRGGRIGGRQGCGETLLGQIGKSAGVGATEGRSRGAWPG